MINACASYHFHSDDRDTGRERGEWRKNKTKNRATWSISSSFGLMRFFFVSKNQFIIVMPEFGKILRWYIFLAIPTNYGILCIWYASDSVTDVSFLIHWYPMYSKMQNRSTQKMSGYIITSFPLFPKHNQTVPRIWIKHKKTQGEKKPRECQKYPPYKQTLKSPKTVCHINTDYFSPTTTTTNWIRNYNEKFSHFQTYFSIAIVVVVVLTLLRICLPTLFDCVVRWSGRLEYFTVTVFRKKG